MLRYVLIADGSSDETLMSVIKWLLDDLYPQLPNEGQFADFRPLPNPPKNVHEKIRRAKYYYSPDIIFYHRDAESVDSKKISERKHEVLAEAADEDDVVCIVPIKMMETWLLIDAEAIKKAAGNRNYKGKITLPAINRLEKVQQPKVELHKLLKEACGLTGRRLDKFNVDEAVHLVAENIEDFSVLRDLTAFSVFENDVKEKITRFIEKYC